jgi:hypothetical protein
MQLTLLVTNRSARCFEIDQEMDAILLIIGIVYGVCRIVIWPRSDVNKHGMQLTLLVTNRSRMCSDL